MATRLGQSPVEEAYLLTHEVGASHVLGAAGDLAGALGEAAADVAAAAVELTERELHERLRLGEVARAEALAEAVKAVVAQLDLGQAVERQAGRARVGIAVRCGDEEMPRSPIGTSPMASVVPVGGH